MTSNASENTREANCHHHPDRVSEKIKTAPGASRHTTNPRKNPRPTPVYKEAESFVAAKLETAGWSILRRNYRRVGCELDIVASKGETLIIVEVKYRACISHARNIQTLIPYKKRQALIRGAKKFLSEGLDNWSVIRFDLAVVHKKRLGRDPVLDYYVNF